MSASSTPPSSRRGRRPVFLGGLFSALAVGVASELDGYEAVAWFALVPLLVSLHRARDAAWWRFFHGASFGVLLSLWMQGWFFSALLVGDGTLAAPARSAAAAGCASTLVWCVFGVLAGLFGIAAGPLLRARSSLVVLLGIPLLWTGIETLRGPFAPSTSRWLVGWQSLGYVFAPGGEVSQVAAFVGVHGLSFMVLFSATSLLLCARTRRFGAQLGWAALAIVTAMLVPAAGGVLLQNEAGSSRDATDATEHYAALISESTGSPTLLVQFARTVAAVDPDIIVCSDSAIPRTANRRELEAFLREFASVWTPPASSGDAGAAGSPPAPRAEAREPDPATTGVVLLTDAGRLVGVYLAARDENGAPIATPGQSLYAARGGRFGLGIDAAFLDTSSARRLASSGAEFLVATVRTGAGWGPRGNRQTVRMQSYRAIETRRWLAYASTTAGYLVRPDGRPVMEFHPGVDGAGVETMRYRAELSVYTRFGWWLEPLSFFAALGIMALGCVRLRTR